MKTSIKRISILTIGASIAAVATAHAQERTVVVRPGDTVIGIAERELGDRNRFPEICRLNRRVLGGDCDWLLVGTVLELPARGGGVRATASNAGSSGERRNTALGTESDDSTEDSRFAYQWTFDSDAEGFSAVNGTLAWQPAGTIEITATATDVMLRSPDALSINGAENTVVSARVRVTNQWGSEPGWGGQCFYQTSAHYESSRYYKTAPNPYFVRNLWTVLRWDMADLSVGGTDWVDSTISRIRIDLQHSAAPPYGTVEVDWIRVGSR